MYLLSLKIQNNTIIVYLHLLRQAGLTNDYDCHFGA